MISTIELRRHILTAADELNLPLTLRQVDQLTTRVAARAARGKHPQLDLPQQRFAVLVGLANGEEAIETGRRLGLSLNTVKTHRRRLFKMLGAENGAHAVAIATRLGILDASAGGQS